MKKLFFYDLETTGTNPGRHGIHQISGEIVIDGKTVETFDYKVQPNPKAQIEDAALEVGGGSTTYFCDYFYTNIPASGSATRGVLFGGRAFGGASAGFVAANAANAPSHAYASIGSRLCFYPIEAAA